VKTGIQYFICNINFYFCRNGGLLSFPWKCEFSIFISNIHSCFWRYDNL